MSFWKDSREAMRRAKLKTQGVQVSTGTAAQAAGADRFLLPCSECSTIVIAKGPGRKQAAEAGMLWSLVDMTGIKIRETGKGERILDGQFGQVLICVACGARHYGAAVIRETLRRLTSEDADNS